MAIKIPKASDAGLGRQQQRAVNTGQDINASPISSGDFTARQIGQVGQSLSNLGNIAVKRYQQQLKVADENAGMESYNGFVKELNEAANLGDNAWFTRKGKNALEGKMGGVYLEAQQTMDKLAEKYSQELKNNRQKNEFFRRVESHRLSMSESLSRYEASQRSVYSIATEKAFVQTNIENASLNYTDPDQIKNAENNIIKITEENREGLPQEALDLRIKARVSLLRTEVISKLSTTAPYKAYSMFQEAKDALTPEDRAKAQNYIERGAEENFYTLLEKDPVKASEALDNGFYAGILDSKKTVQFRNAIDTQVNNMAKRAQTNQFLSTLKNENQLFDSIVESNREDAFKKLYEYGKGFNADPAFIEKTRDILLKSKGPSASEKDQALSQLESTFQSLDIKKKEGEYSIDKTVAPKLPLIIQFNRDVELARLNGSITTSQANSYRKRMTPILIEAVKAEQGYDDKGIAFWGEDTEKYDKGTQVIQGYIKKNNIPNDSPEKVKFISKFFDLYDKIPEDKKTDPIELDKYTKALAVYVTEGFIEEENPVFAYVGIPNASIDKSGNVKNIKEGKTDTKPSQKISEDFVVKKGKDGNDYRVYKDGRVELINISN